MDCAQRAERRRVFLSGVRDGVPIGLGYLAVAFSLGIAARNAGLNAFQGFLISLLNNASAGEYAAFTVIAADSGFLEMALITLITNARYLLMSCSLSQKFSPDTPLYHRLLVGYDVTDELFGIAIARPGYLDPFYSYGAFVPAIPGWAIGTALGVTAGSLLPARVVSALSVALFGMFLAIIIPPSKKNPVVLGCVCVSFAASWLCSVLPLTSGLSEGTRTILLTILIASAAAALFHYSKALGIPALVIAALVGFSRLYLFVHFPTDVLVGAVIGVLLAVVSCIVTDKIAASIKRFYRTASGRRLFSLYRRFE